MPAYRAALAILRSPDDAQDALQEAAMRAWQKLSELREPNAWGAWFHRIAVRVALDHAHKIRREEETSRRLLIAISLPDPTSQAAEHMTVMTALSELPPDDRAILALRYGADLEVPVVAATLGIRLGTAKARLHRAIGRLKNKLGDET